MAPTKRTLVCRAAFHSLGGSPLLEERLANSSCTNTTKAPARLRPPHSGGGVNGDNGLPCCVCVVRKLRRRTSASAPRRASNRASGGDALAGWPKGHEEQLRVHVAFARFDSPRARCNSAVVSDGVCLCVCPLKSKGLPLPPFLQLPSAQLERPSASAPETKTHCKQKKKKFSAPSRE